MFSVFYLIAVYRESTRTRARPKPLPVDARPIQPADMGEIADFKPPDEGQIVAVLDKVRALEPAGLAEHAVPFSYNAVLAHPERWRFAPVKITGVLYTANKQRLKGMSEDFMQIELADDALNLITLLVTKWPGTLKVGHLVTVAGVFYTVRSYRDREGKSRYSPVVVAPDMTAKHVRFSKRRDYTNQVILVLVCLAVALILLSLALRKFAHAELPESEESGEDREEEVERQGAPGEEQTDEENDIDEENDESFD